MTRKTSTAVVIFCFFLSACAGTDPDTNEKIGTTAGTVIGAVIGSQIGGSFDKNTGRILGASLGAIFGAILGKEIARTLNEADLKRADEAAQNTMETGDTGQTVTWRNPDSGNSGTYKPTSAPQQIDGENCREFESTVVISGKEQTAKGRACRQPDGSWRITQ